MEVSGKMEMFWDTGAFDFDRGLLGDASVELTRKLTEKLSIGVATKFYAPIQSLNDGRKSTWTHGLFVVKSF